MHSTCKPVQQAVPGRLGPILRGLNGSTCWTVPAHLKDRPSRAGPWTPTDWPGMAHKPGGLAVLTGLCRWAVPTGRAGGLAHIKFCFLIKSIVLKKKLYIICGNANFLFLKPRKNIFIYMFFKITKNLKY